MKVLITICARGGSKGIPGKNIKELNKLPLIAYSINVAKQFKEKYKMVDIQLSTDSYEIRKVAKEYGLDTDYIRPEYLAGDLVGKIDAIKDILEYAEGVNNTTYDYIIDLDVTSPLRTLADLSEAFKQISTNDTALNLFSVSPANRSPYFNMVEQKSNGFYSLVNRSDKNILTRQSAPEVYDMNASFYFYKRAFFTEGYKTVFTEASMIYEMSHICFDLDHPIDFDFISYLIENNKLDFEL